MSPASPRTRRAHAIVRLLASFALGSFVSFARAQTVGAPAPSGAPEQSLIEAFVAPPSISPGARTGAGDGSPDPLTEPLEADAPEREADVAGRAYVIGFAVSTGLAAGTEACLLRGCFGTQSWTGFTVGFGALAGAGAGVGMHFARPTRGGVAVLGAAPRISSLLTWELMAALRFKRTRGSDFGGSTLHMEPAGILGGFLASHVAGYGLAVAVNRTVRPRLNEVFAATSTMRMATMYAFTLAVTLGDGFNRIDRLHAGLFAASAGGLVVGGIAGRRLALRPGQVVAMEVIAYLTGGLGVTLGGVVGRGDGSLLGIGLGAAVGMPAGAIAGYFATNRVRSARRQRSPFGVVSAFQVLPDGALWAARGTFR